MVHLDPRDDPRTDPGAANAPREASVRASREATVADLLAAADGPLYSFEFFPPRNEKEVGILWRTVRELEAYQPDFISVTYGANGSTRERTIRATAEISANTTLRTVAHLTCASQSVDQLRQVVGQYAAAGVRQMLAIRGDMPGGPTVPWERHPQGLDNATELVSLIKELGNFCVGVAAFPDIHPEHKDPDLDADLLVAKAEAGADYAITQLFFEAQNYFDLVDRVRSRGCDLPIIPGLMPVTTLRQIEIFADLSGQPLPASVVDRLTGVAPDDVRAEGIAIATELCEALLAGGAPGLHFFTQNRSKATREIFANLHPSRDPA
ncbi:methylenetetrahydrofolate reductase [NAD(P)H] [Propionibacteriaceae bacterium Y1685]|uniref:methylenetetrahydrofolate reductase [NAD(P)H] n=1 Tax=Microlunatus sp. Y1700 TaxID=3418487 RepID=UPI003B7A872A